MCIKLVIKTNLYYDARSEKHQIQRHCHYLMSRAFIHILSVPVLSLYYTARTKNLINRTKIVRFPPESVTCKLSLKSSK
jgi:hypothetical protein